MTNRNYQNLKNVVYEKIERIDREAIYYVVQNIEKVFLLFDEFDSQVSNGGLEQWVANGYGNEKSIEALVGIIFDYADANSAITKHILDMLQVAEELLYEEKRKYLRVSYLLDYKYSEFNKKERIAFFQGILDRYDESCNPFVMTKNLIQTA
nr:hypothetical protein 28 [bacterium]